MNQREKQAHWDKAYAAKSTTSQSWYRPHLEISLALIRRAAPDLSTPVIDIGAGESTLLEDLIAGGYTHLSALDISPQALQHLRTRLGPASNRMSWHCGDILTIPLRQAYFGLWHDRAVFHFLTSPAVRAAYVNQAASALRPGGHVILATFAPNGPTQCSGLPVMRHDANSILHEFGPRFRLEATATELHTTPAGATQPFIYCDLTLR